MNFYESKSHLSEVIFELSNFVRGLYPPFVTSPRPEGVPADIPCFSFHDVLPETFEAQLLFLKRNGYETVTIGEYLAARGKSEGRRRVLLTFDDGRESLWKVAYPLLKKHSMKAAAFVLPAEIKEADGARKTFDGQGGAADNAEELCTWPEIEAMGDVIDVQSHSLSHFIMFVSDRAVDFFSPRIKARWMKIEWPIMNEAGDAERLYQLGAPFYEMDSRLSDELRIFEPPSIREALAKVVEGRGGESFFETQGWEKTLAGAHGKAARGAIFRRETSEERDAAILHVLAESKRILDQRLDKNVTSLCLPFGIGGKAAMAAAVRAGYKAVFWGVRAPEWISQFPELVHVTRIKDDYLFRLPGEGRRPLHFVFTEKFRRRLRFAVSGKGRLR